MKIQQAVISITKHGGVYIVSDLCSKPALSLGEYRTLREAVEESLLKVKSTPLLKSYLEELRDQFEALDWDETKIISGLSEEAQNETKDTGAD
jgi:hypothetical protein